VQLRWRPETAILIRALSQILEICEATPKHGLDDEENSAREHIGEWRGAEMAQWCSLTDHPEGVSLCAHEGGVVAKPHWSCCGATKEQAPCCQDTENGCVNASGAQKSSVGLPGLHTNQYTSLDQRVNDEGAPMTMSRMRWVSNFYCGREVGVNRVPGSDGFCGPNHGPQCPSCQRWSPPNSSHGAGSPRWSLYQLRCEVVLLCGLPVYRSPEVSVDGMKVSGNSSSSSSSALNYCARLPWGVFPMDTLEAVLVYKSGGGWLKLHPHAVDRLRELKPLISSSSAHVPPVLASHDNVNDGDDSVWWVPLRHEGRSAFVRLAGPAAVVSAAPAPRERGWCAIAREPPGRRLQLRAALSCSSGHSTSTQEAFMAATRKIEAGEEEAIAQKNKSTAHCRPGGQCVSCITYRPLQNRAGLIVYPGYDCAVFASI